MFADGLRDGSRHAASLSSDRPCHTGGKRAHLYRYADSHAVVDTDRHTIAHIDTHANGYTDIHQYADDHTLANPHPFAYTHTTPLDVDSSRSCER